MFRRRDVQLILWMTFLTVAAWVGFNIYHIVVTSTISEELAIQITPINPNFDMQTIAKLKTRQNVVPLYQFQGGNPESTATASSTLTPSPSASTSAVDREGL